jgi:hypothetical protein
MGGLRIPRLIGVEGDAFIKAQLLASPTLVASEPCRLYKQRFGLTVSRASMNWNIRELGATAKRGWRPPEKDRADVVAKRALFDWLGSRLPAGRPVVVDEGYSGWTRLSIACRRPADCAGLHLFQVPHWTGQRRCKTTSGGTV